MSDPVSKQPSPLDPMIRRIVDQERIAAIRARVNGPSKSYSVRYSIQTLREFPQDVAYLLAELENQAEVIRHLQDAAVTLQTMRDEARAAALEEAAKIAEAAAEVYDGYANPTARRDARTRNLEKRDAADYVAERIREAASPRQAEEP